MSAMCVPDVATSRSLIELIIVSRHVGNAGLIMVA